MTMRSIIGFGQHKDLCVQELIQLNKHKDLISMYYNLEKIDFDSQVKQALRITDERIIVKPGKDPPKYMQNIYKMVQEIHEALGTFKEGNQARFNTLHEKQHGRKQQIVSNCIRQNKQKSKIANRGRNQRYRA
jgi:NCAIR mutase (PurE)-related protein